MKVIWLDQVSKCFPGLYPASRTNSTVTDGIALNQLAQNRAYSGSVLINVGAATGAPTSFSIVYQLQDSPDNVNWTNVVSGTNTGPGSVTVTAQGQATLPFNPQYQNQYLRVVETVTITGGTSPTVPTSSIMVLCDPRNAPGFN